ncbi:hypothetical protein THRCLA_01597 [Thraustotheca clavata]|uniref:Myb/SANT-like domain-containing protein n=1 Tax=Thraustotheca clavata TaxID=74557 RepID=A0A1W0A7S9_9STRA|nr:hypothetical protein THRCLA_01597 [Thraustotheca clavata]
MTSTLSAQWNDERDGVLIQGFHAQVSAGRTTSNGGLKKDGWHHLLRYFNSLLDLNYQKSQLQSRWTILKKRHSLFKLLKTSPDFQWDAEHQLPVASQAVWNDFIAKYPDALQYRTTPLPYFNELDAILSGEVGQIEAESSDTDDDGPRKGSRKRMALESPGSNIPALKSSRIDTLMHAETLSTVGSPNNHHQMARHLHQLHSSQVHASAEQVSTVLSAPQTPLERAITTFFSIASNLSPQKKLKFSQYLASGHENSVIMFNCIDEETKWQLINDILAEDDES